MSLSLHSYGDDMKDLEVKYCSINLQMSTWQLNTAVQFVDDNFAVEYHTTVQICGRQLCSSLLLSDFVDDNLGEYGCTAVINWDKLFWL